MLNISERDLATISTILRDHLGNGQVIAFGSRVTRNSKPYSDLDLAISRAGNEPLGWRILADVREAFEESDLDFRIDIVRYDRLSPAFREMVDRTGVTLLRA